jgi:hypothetical protein
MRRPSAPVEANGRVIQYTAGGWRMARPLEVGPTADRQLHEYYAAAARRQAPSASYQQQRAHGQRAGLPADNATAHPNAYATAH